MSFEQHYLRVVSGESRGPAASAARAGLSLLSPAYALAVRARNRAFDAGLKRAKSLPRPVVSVGNLTVGGTGKTPVVAALAAELLARGRRPAVVLRGYKARPDAAGDEQLLLGELLGEAVPVAADPDRPRAAARVLAARPDVDLFLLDDGFQHRRVRRAFDLVLIDATRPFGFGRTLPRGLLREPVGGLRRASGVLVTRRDLAPPGRLAEIEQTVRRHTAAPVWTSCFALSAFADAAGRPAALPAGAVLALCGIANAAAFADNLAAAGATVAELLRFADHHDYAADDVAEAVGRLRFIGAAAVVTTGKDWVKLRPLWPADVPVLVARQQLQVDGDGWSELMKAVLAATARR